jgi:hypothetical protein
MVHEWEERLDFVRRYDRDGGREVRRVERIVNLLRWQGAAQTVNA